MEITLTKVLVFIAIALLTGGLWFYVKKFKALMKEFKEFVQVTFSALKDRKLTVVEKEKIMKEWADLKPIAKSIKLQFDKSTGINEEIKEIYLKVKKGVKDETKKKKNLKKITKTVKK